MEHHKNNATLFIREVEAAWQLLMPVLQVAELPPSDFPHHAFGYVKLRHSKKKERDKMTKIRNRKGL